MKKSIYSTATVFSILAIILFLNAFINRENNIILFWATAAALAVTLIILYVYMIKTRLYINDLIKSVNDAFGIKNKKMLNSFVLPVLIVDDKDVIMWSNSRFFDEIDSKNKFIGEKVYKYISGKTVRQLKKNKSVNVDINDKNYNVICSEFDSGVVLIFMDNTPYRNLIKENNENQPCVLMINFDNGEELQENDVDSGIYIQILAQVEKTLTQWTADLNAFMRKLSNERYIVVMKEKNLEKCIENKFNILDKIREIHFAKNRYTTISIGVGHKSKNFNECELWARKALDMALGRGGDQAVIKDKDKFMFFGGVSNGIERKDRIKIRIVASMITENINKCDKVFIMGHKFSDLDSMGACIGLWGMISNVFKTPAFIVANEEESSAKKLIEYAKDNGAKKAFLSVEKALQRITSDSLLIIVDTYAAGFTESQELCSKANNIVVIDHHRMGTNGIKNAAVLYHDSYASSACEMVTDLCRYMGDNPIKGLEAQAMLAGIMLDTKNFVFKTGVRTFEAAAYLKEIGVDMISVKRLFADDIETYRSKYELVSMAQIYDGYAVSCTEEIKNNINVSAAQAADELLNINGVKASFVIYKTPKSVNVSARSLGDVNVQVLVERLGGGGHQSMAGAQIKGTSVRIVKKKILKLIYEEIETQKRLQQEGRGKN